MFVCGQRGTVVAVVVAGERLISLRVQLRCYVLCTDVVTSCETPLETMSTGGGFRWTVVVLTCQHKDSVYSFQRGEEHLLFLLSLSAAVTPIGLAVSLMDEGF